MSTTPTTTFIKENAINNFLLTSVAIMPFSTLFVFSSFLMEDLLNMILKVEHHFGNLRSKFKISSLKWKESINCQMNGHGDKKIFVKVILRELIIKFAFKDSRNFLSSTKIKISIICLIHGVSSIKICFSKMTVKNN